MILREGVTDGNVAVRKTLHLKQTRADELDCFSGHRTTREKTGTLLNSGGNVKDLARFLHEHSPGGLLPWASQAAAAKQFGLSCAQVEAIALESKILPSRYQRNQQTLSTDDQLKLFRSRVVVVGCGGLGGYIIEELARLGVGTLVVIDPDVFEEHNLNRQLFSTIASLGLAKVDAVASRVAEVNPVVTLMPIRAAWLPETGRELLANADVVADAVDSMATRLVLAEACSELQIPFVHGAIAGWYGQIATQFPGASSVRKLYEKKERRGIERELGNPAFTPALIASLQTAEVCKVLLGVGRTLCSRILFVDLLDMTFSEMTVAAEQRSAEARP
jgi:molybdopterin/thiamine biosynthesis adenylyltransferase